MDKARHVYKAMFGRYLLITNTATCGSLLAIGDSIVQQIERLDDKEKKYCLARTGRMFCMGFVLGPFNHFWYRTLDKFLPGATGLTVGKKILCDQTVAAPFFCSSFFLGMSLMEGKSVEASMDEVKAKFLTVYLIDWCVWPAAQFVNFFFLPTHFRVVYVSTMTLFWNTFLSWIKHREHSHIF